MTASDHAFAEIPQSWTHRHLLDLERLSADDITLLLDTAAAFKHATNGCRTKLSALAGSTVVNLFFESSTRTKTSFALAARRLGADVVDFSAAGSSLSKGESFIDTAGRVVGHLQALQTIADATVFESLGEFDWQHNYRAMSEQDVARRTC